LDLRGRLWPYLGGIAKQNQIKTLAICGVSDHVHVLLSLPATLSVAKAMQLLKGNSSKWIRETFPKMHSFAWQALAQNKEYLFCRVRQLYGGT
jgi:REP element-mobilizing transposase RayT